MALLSSNLDCRRKRLLKHVARAKVQHTGARRVRFSHIVRTRQILRPKRPPSPQHPKMDVGEGETPAEPAEGKNRQEKRRQSGRPRKQRLMLHSGFTEDGDCFKFF